MKCNNFLIWLFSFLFSFHFLNAQIITTIAGTDSAGYSGDGFPATAAKFSSPHDLVVLHGYVYVSDQNNNRIRKISPSGLITTIAGTGTAGYMGDGGQATAAELNLPTGLAIDTSGNLYIADQSNYRIRKINTSGIITTIAGNGGFAFSGDGIQATATGLFPSGVAADNSGNIYIAEQSNYRIRKVNNAGIITTIAGVGTGGFSGDGGPATDAQIAPSGVAVDNSGNVYVADVFNNRVRIINTSGIINTFAGNGSAGYGGDGDPATADSVALQAPQCVRIDSIGNVYIADNFNDRIRKVDTSGIISTIAGNGTAGFSGDNGPATAAELNAPSGVAIDATGKVYIADNFNNRIRRSGPPDLMPITGIFTVCAGDSTTLSNSTSGGTWSSSNTSKATVGSASGVVTGIGSDTVTIIYSIYDSAVKVIITVSVCPDGIKSVRGITEDAFKIYPNPNEGTFAFILYSAYAENMNIIITNLLGQKIKEISAITNEETEIHLDSSPGIYFINTITPQGIIRTKILME